ncbi:tripartite tricarboxylate transporter permease [Salisediminibacterium halotolerans]|uniref:Tricarboxylic transport membrane protein n=1 Tax=Salisediminibacterium halotolerans TaxID=517425 RepID=A0A1H9WD88_9BACI|nr:MULTISPECIES: tripartite tricarboxylate transporter permease [Salisediminibacterium]RLJ73208.1 putative tricarboxylic transport membrane protein [Actinophytocola xinjiangensis]RPE86630.1 putative tricarboxylic transport membrane protein [Salisediminibacterium halotolerans]TWG34005.1 putative tricarboxylic transport membrane protein [Salisediminibacterium halotolerans]SES31888.1 putative tricarboxylic transport membrane protein [Salisediminibacterium haloalkalitolerans]GEL06588.1 C4-dicarbox
MQAMDILVGILSFEVFLIVFAGVLIGVMVGAVPGLNGAIGISLLLPLTFAMEPQIGLLLLGGIYMGGMYGGSITAILLNVPGDVVAAPAAMEGYPLTRQGRAKEALYYSIFSSMFGGLIGVLVLIFFTPPLANFALQFGPAEMFFITLSGLIIIGAIAGENIYKSFFAALIGLFISTIGMDMATATERFTFDSQALRAGIPVIPIVLGMFCFAEMFHNLGKKANEIVTYKDQQIKRMTVFKDIVKNKWLVIKGGFFGTVIGLLPGVGTTLAVFMSYGEAKRVSKRREEFEKGNQEGIIAAESANNATVGSTMVPLLALGVPGSPTTAIIAGALIIHGIILGPDLFVNRPDVAYTFLYGMLFTVVAMGIIGVFGIKYFAYILKIRMEYIVPTVLVFALFGAYSFRNSVFDVLAAIVIGIFGALFKKLNVPLAPVIIGVVLGPLIETNLTRSMTIAEAQNLPLLQYMLTNPLAMFLFALVFVILYIVIRMRRRTF